MRGELLSAIFLSILIPCLVQAVPRFYIDYETNTFIKDEKPFQYISGSIHSYRVPREYWSDRLNKMWAAGLNTIQIYSFWNEHEPTPGVFDFSGQNDIFEFMNQAHKIGFLIIFRPGPYICGEHDYGALPWWLLSDGIDRIQPRTSEATYMKAVTRWFDVLLPKLVPYLYNNGGPIIMVQVENEYGSFPACDYEYTGQLRDLFRKHLGDETFLFTTDGDGVNYLKCGAIKGTYATVDFGSGTNVTTAFAAQRAYSPAGPFVNSEFYPGWLDHWGQPHQKVSTAKIVKTFQEMMCFKANVNFYMFHGGTNFGFSNGANQKPFLTGPTSYDYDAPLTEAGDVTPKYMDLRESISKYFPLPKVPIPANQTKKAYGKVQMNLHSSLIESILALSDSCIKTELPESFEKLGQGYGIILYSTTLKDIDLTNANLSIPGIRDRGYVVVGNTPVGTLMRENNTDIMINLKNNKDNRLYIIVENLGRLNFGDRHSMLDTKGILSNVYLNGQVLTQWTTCLTSNFIPNFQMGTPGYVAEKMKQSDLSYSGPRVYIGQFKIEENYSSFLKMDKFTKGIALVGSETITNLGRYWPSKGPQVTLYTPGAFLQANAYNYIVLIEFEGASCTSDEDCFVEFIDYPIIDSLP